MASELTRYAAGNARVRTLASRLLGRPGLEALYTYPSAQGVVDALQRTAYGDAIAGADRAELRLSERLATVGRALLAWLRDPERGFVHEYLLRYEVANLAIVMRALHAQTPWERIAPYLRRLEGIATVDIQELARAGSVAALVEQLAGSRYAAAAQSALHRLPRAGPFALEVALELDYYERLWAATAALRAVDAVRARAILGALYDIINLGWIACYRDIWGLSPEEILNYTLRQGRWITLEVRRRLAEERAGGWQQALVRTPYAGCAAAIETGGFDAVAADLWRLLASQIQRALSGYPFHIGGPLGLLVMQEIEIRDLHALLAAKRLQIPPREAMTYLASVRH